VIIRISTEGQYELDDSETSDLNELDNAAVAACEGSDEVAFRENYTRLLDFVRSHGHPVEDDHLGGSDLILPPPDVSIEEARSELTSEGLFPG
jgi:hypothetical protein